MTGTTVAGSTPKLLIAGEWVEGSRGAVEVLNPATEEVLALAPEASVGDAAAAAASARAAQPGWAATPAAERARLLDLVARRLLERRDELVALTVAETGFVTAASTVFVDRCAGYFAYAARAAARDLSIPTPAGAGSASGRRLGAPQRGRPEAADRRGGVHRALQRPALRGRDEELVGSGDGQHRGREAGSAEPARRARALPHLRRGRVPRRRRERGHELRPRRGWRSWRRPRTSTW